MSLGRKSCIFREPDDGLTLHHWTKRFVLLCSSHIHCLMESNVSVRSQAQELFSKMTVSTLQTVHITDIMCSAILQSIHLYIVMPINKLITYFSPK